MDPILTPVTGSCDTVGLQSAAGTAEGSRLTHKDAQTWGDRSCLLCAADGPRASVYSSCKNTPERNAENLVQSFCMSHLHMDNTHALLFKFLKKKIRGCLKHRLRCLTGGDNDSMTSRMTYQEREDLSQSDESFQQLRLDFMTFCLLGKYKYLHSQVQCYLSLYTFFFFPFFLTRYLWSRWKDYHFSHMWLVENMIHF